MNVYEARTDPIRVRRIVDTGNEVFRWAERWPADKVRAAMFISPARRRPQSSSQARLPFGLPGRRRRQPSMPESRGRR
eukprot:4844318-Pleurochrysis_carterae.AAC.2